MEGKKIFSLYTDLINLVNGSNIHGVEIEPMSDEETGQLFRWILEYVNDLHPIVPKNIKYAVAQVKKALDEDLERYKEKCKKNKENINKRWHSNENNNIPNNTNEYERIPSNTKNTDKDIDKDKDKDIEVSKDTNINVSFNKETTPEATKIMPPVVITLPCLKGYNHPIYEDDIKHYQELYPAVNVHQELKLMLGWLESNPTNRKTKNGIKSFITRWLSKKQDKRTIIPSDSKDKWDGYKFNEI